MSLEHKLEEIISSDTRLMDILKAARELNLNDWYVAGGAIRNTVWDIINNFKEHTPLNDADLVYFDLYTASDEYDQKLSERMNKKLPIVKWEVENQFKYESHSESFKSTVEGIARWIETPTCVGVRLEKDNSLTMCAPWGLEDLFNGVIRINPKWPKPEYFKERMEKKRWDKVWSKVKYVL